MGRCLVKGMALWSIVGQPLVKVAWLRSPPIDCSGGEGEPTMPELQEELTLLNKLRELSQREGVRRANLYGFLGPELRRLWHIDEERADIVRAKVTIQLERLIQELPESTYRL